MSETKDIDADALQLAQELIADDTGDMLIDYCDVVGLLAKLVGARTHWRGLAPFTISDVGGVTGVEIRAWLTVRGWIASNDTGNGEHGHGRTWRPKMYATAGVQVYDKNSPQGIFKTLDTIGYHFGINPREVVDQLAAVARVRAKVIELSNAGEQVDDIAYQFGMTSAEVLEIVGGS